MNGKYLINNKYIVDLNFPVSCSCFDFKTRHEDKGTFCKHITGLIEELKSRRLRQ